MMLRNLLPVIAMVAFSHGASAQVQPAGPFAEIRGGVNFLADSDVEQAGVTDEIDFDTGAVVEAGLGYGFGNGLRGEIALGYRSNDNDQFAGVDVGGDVTALSLMANGYYEFDAGGPALHPFIGAGLGVAKIDVDVSAFGVNIADDDDTVFAYQAMAGLAYDFTPTMAGTLRYAYFATSDPSLTDASGAGFDAEYDSHAVMVGLILAF